MRLLVLVTKRVPQVRILYLMPQHLVVEQVHRMDITVVLLELLNLMLEECKVVIVGSEYPEIVRACKMIPAATMNEALALAAEDLGAEQDGDLDALIVPHALLTLPVVEEVAGW